MAGKYLIYVISHYSFFFHEYATAATPMPNAIPGKTISDAEDVVAGCGVVSENSGIWVKFLDGTTD